GPGDGDVGRTRRIGLDVVLGSRAMNAGRSAWYAVAVAVGAISLLAAREALAQAPPGEVTIDELVARAVAENPELRVAREEIDAAAGRLQQAGLRPNPMLELS